MQGDARIGAFRVLLAQLAGPDYRVASSGAVSLDVIWGDGGTDRAAQEHGGRRHRLRPRRSLAPQPGHVAVSLRNQVTCPSRFATRSRVRLAPQAELEHDQGGGLVSGAWVFAGPAATETGIQDSEQTATEQLQAGIKAGE